MIMIDQRVLAHVARGPFFPFVLEKRSEVRREGIGEIET